MEFALDDAQRTLVDAVDALLADRAGPARAIALGPGGYDDALGAALRGAGYDRVANVAGGLIQWSRLALPFRDAS